MAPGLWENKFCFQIIKIVVLCYSSTGKQIHAGLKVSSYSCCGSCTRVWEQQLQCHPVIITPSWSWLGNVSWIAIFSRTCQCFPAYQSVDLCMDCGFFACEVGRLIPSFRVVVTETGTTHGPVPSPESEARQGNNNLHLHHSFLAFRLSSYPWHLASSNLHMNSVPPSLPSFL